MTDTLEGGCACGRLRYRMQSKPMFVHCCHCKDCQRQTGSAFVINAIIETDRIEALAGEAKPTPVPTDSGRPHDVYRCETCRTALWSDYGRRPYVRFVRVGTLDEPGALPPDAHIFTRSKVPWVALPDGQPAFEIYYDTDKQWSAEALARRAAMTGRA